MPDTTAFFTALAAAFAAADAAGLPAGLTAAFALGTLALGTLALGALTAAALAAEALIDEDAREAGGALRAVALLGAFAAKVSLALVTFLAGAFALVVFAAVLADLAAAFFVETLVALLVAALVALLAADFVAEALPPAGAFTAALALDAPVREDGGAAVAAFARADLAVFATEPRERVVADLPAPLFFSFFVADGIRGLLLLRPAVETGRNCRPLTARGNTARSASLSI